MSCAWALGGYLLPGLQCAFVFTLRQCADRVVCYSSARSIGGCEVNEVPPATMPTNIQQVLVETFGLVSFRPLQRDIIGPLLNGESVLGILPTGAGKSLCYQLPSQVLGGLTIVISPLIALMRDQVSGLWAKKIAAAALYHHQDGSMQERIFTALRERRLSLLYVAPERLRQPRLVRALEAISISLLVVDEAHLISEWGHDFRPDYQGIREFRQRVGNPPVLAVTATATPPVKRDIIQALLLDQGPFHVVEGSVDRPNLHLSVIKVGSAAEKRERVRKMIARSPGAVLIYVDSRARTETWARWLSTELGEPVAAYHAGMPSNLRQSVERRFLGKELRVVAATNAFGMGVDRPDIRMVIHVGIPESLDAYYQEIGRAGRDGEPGLAALFWQDDDLRRRQWRIRQDQPDRGGIRRILMRMEQELARGQKELWEWGADDSTVPMMLALLEEMGYLDIEEKGIAGARMERLQCPWPASLEELLWNRVSVQYQSRLERFGAMRLYLEGAGVCRRQRLIEYFGQSLPLLARLDCCDRCDRLQRGEGAETTAVEGPDGLDPGDLMRALRAWRTNIARTEGIAPYLVLHDRVLQEICQRMPKTHEQLGGCHGIGPKKLERFGDAILALVRDHDVESAAGALAVGDDTAMARAFALFDNNLALPRVLTRIPRSAATVIGYLERWIAQANGDVARAYGFSLIHPENYQAIRRAFQIEGDDRLKPVMDRLAGTVSYQDLRIARALYRREKTERRGEPNPT